MLRSIVIAVGIVALGGAVLALMAGLIGPAIAAGITGAILLAGTLFERVRYKPLLPQGPANAVRTGERFYDEAARKTVTVYVDPATGERSYVED